MTIGIKDYKYTIVLYCGLGNIQIKLGEYQ